MDMSFVSANYIWLIMICLVAVGIFTRFTFTQACICLMFLGVVIFLGSSLYEVLSGVAGTLNSNPALSLSRTN